MLTRREGLMMYWCEGDKSQESRTYRVALTSVDFNIIKLFIEWLENYYGVNKLQIKIRLHLWPDANEQLVKDFWSTNLCIPLQNFTKTWFKPRGSRIKKNTYPYGICRASVSSKELLHKIISDIDKEFIML